MPVAVVSANLQDEIIARARELNAAFVAKPLTDEALGSIFVRRGSSSQESGTMKIDASELSEIEQDALAEIANMGVSRAATSLRQMVGEQVLLSVPCGQHREPSSRRSRSWNEATRRNWLRCSNRSRARSRDGSADLSASAEPGARPVDRGRRALSGGCDRSGAGGARGDRQHHPECVPGHDRECVCVARCGCRFPRSSGETAKRCSMFARPTQAAIWCCFFTSTSPSRIATFAALSPCSWTCPR